MSTVFDKKAIVGTFDLTSQSPASYTLLDSSVFRVQYLRNNNSTSIYISAKFCIITVEDIKVFVGVYTDESNNEYTIIQIPLLGQTISDLVTQINKYADTYAEVVNSMGYISVGILFDTAYTASNGSWVYFAATDPSANSVFFQLQKDLRFHLTSIEPLSEQKNYTQSIGGFVSTSQVSKGYMLYESMSIYDKTLVIDPANLSNDITIVDFQKNVYLQVNDEIVRVEKWVAYSAYLSERNVFDTPLRMHAKGTIVRELIQNSFFDLNLSASRKQYRCLAIKNTNVNNIAKDLRVYFNINNRNNLSTIKIAIETPKSDYYAGSSSTTGITSFSSYDLMNKFANNHFVGAALKFTSGGNANQVRIVDQFIASSGTLILNERLPYVISAGDEFFIDTAPATRIKSTSTMPVGTNISQFYTPAVFENAIPINIQGSRSSGNDLKPQEVIYVWFERSIATTNDEYDNNRFALSLSFSKV